MKQKRNRFLTFVFSLLPGAGHMFMGFMKMGLSMMSGFFFIIFLGSWLNIAPLLFILPMIWFYSFFDCINKTYAKDEEFEKLEDSFLFSMDKLMATNSYIFVKRRLITGILLLILGVYMLWNNIIRCLSWHIPREVYNTLEDITRYTPQVILGIVVIGIGIKFIIGKKRESDDNV
jgi:hypothetical protein